MAHPDVRHKAHQSSLAVPSAVGRRTEHAGQTTIARNGLHAHCEQARAILMHVSALLQAIYKEAAEQMAPRSVWQRVCGHHQQIIAGIGPPKSLRLLGILRKASGNSHDRPLNPLDSAIDDRSYLR